MPYYVYIMSTESNKVVYIGVTDNLARRVYEHKNKLVKGFTERYNVNKLVYFEAYTEVKKAIAREKQIKTWSRDKKNWLIQRVNPEWAEITLRGTFD